VSERGGELQAVARGYARLADYEAVSAVHRPVRAVVSARAVQKRAVADPEELRVLSASRFQPVGAGEYRVLARLARRRIRTNGRLLPLPRLA
jgi:hypothetical protein